MLLVDPLYQRCLAAECRARGVPVIFDEVFTGIWRLGAMSAAHRLGIQPDIACYAKLLTGEPASCLHRLRTVMTRRLATSATVN